MVLSARGGTQSAQSALARLCEIYWYPLYAYVRRQGYSPHDAQDLTQDFFARLLQKAWLDDVERERGRFRAFLLAAMKHFLANARDHARAAKRGGGSAPLPLDEEIAEARYQRESAEHVTAEQLFEQRWAQALLAEVMNRLRQEMEQAGKLRQFEALKFSLTGEKTAYADVARTLGMSESAVKVAVHRLRSRYRELLRLEIAETVSTPEEINDELRHLFAALSI
jgi:RNA polymerase sigma-70 factor (ECF subfamily)